MKTWLLALLALGAVLDMCAATPFETVWETTSAGENITLPLEFGGT
jgi:hypothetical protein